MGDMEGQGGRDRETGLERWKDRVGDMEGQGGRDGRTGWEREMHTQRQAACAKLRCAAVSQGSDGCHSPTLSSLQSSIVRYLGCWVLLLLTGAAWACLSSPAVDVLSVTFNKPAGDVSVAHRLQSASLHAKSNITKCLSVCWRRGKGG